MLSSSITLSQDPSSVPHLVNNSVQNSLLLFHLHLSVVYYVFEIQPYFTNCIIASGAGSMVVITGECPQLPLSTHTPSIL